MIIISAQQLVSPVGLKALRTITLLLFIHPPRSSDQKVLVQSSPIHNTMCPTLQQKLWRGEKKSDQTFLSFSHFLSIPSEFRLLFKDSFISFSKTNSFPPFHWHCSLQEGDAGRQLAEGKQAPLPGLCGKQEARRSIPGSAAGIRGTDEKLCKLPMGPLRWQAAARQLLLRVLLSASLAAWR